MAKPGLIRLAKEIFDVGHDITHEKNWYASKTIWFNILLLAFDLYARFCRAEFPITGEELDSIAVALAVIGNIVLRFRTKRPIVLSTRCKTGSAHCNDRQQ